MPQITLTHVELERIVEGLTMLGGHWQELSRKLAKPDVAEAYRRRAEEVDELIEKLDLTDDEAAA